MLTKNEKKLMVAISEKCGDECTHLFSVADLEKVFKKNSHHNIPAMIATLAKHGFIIAEKSSKKTGSYFLIILSMKGVNFKNDVQRETRKLISTILKTIALALISFLVSLVLKNTLL